MNQLFHSLKVEIDSTLKSKNNNILYTCEIIHEMHIQNKKSKFLKQKKKKQFCKIDLKNIDFLYQKNNFLSVKENQKINLLILSIAIKIFYKKFHQ